MIRGPPGHIYPISERFLQLSKLVNRSLGVIVHEIHATMPRDLPKSWPYFFPEYTLGGGFK